ncbi:GNAT family N-acetyltransferase [Pseudonocardia acaciae]|uniref:GNAT family N-acetyltransferase n=1 Tax=Pseudonocardia acaciae TaxID=551276 RepID=UPI00056BDD42|nr:GNAT family N-acetyltransferase [Pseudonocardia acaciae]
MKFEIRHALPDDLLAMSAADSRAFGITYTSTDIDDFRPLFDPDRYLLAYDPADATILGVTGAFPFEITVPGGATLATEGVTWVSVAATHRRQGILRGLMDRQHREHAEQGVALSVLTASEGGIYGRFGYGQASRQREVRIDRRLARMRADAPNPGGVRYVDAEEARALAPDVHRRWAAVTPGALSRSEPWWDHEFVDRAERRGGGTELFHLVHPDGYASYRIHQSDRSCRVVDFFAATEDAHAALWRVLLGLDLTHTVTSEACPLDDPLPWLLEDPRQVRTTDLADGLWARILDVERTLAARRYPVDIDAVLDVADPFLDLGGRFRLRGGPGGASCERVTSEPDAHLNIATLAMLYFGSHRAHAMARAGLLAADDPAVLAALDSAFAADREVRHGTHF